MHIENSINISALGRNPKLVSLKPGDTVKAHIYERIDQSRAVLNIAGNKMTAFFKSGLPVENTLLLKITFKSPHKIMFSLEKNAPPKMLPDIGFPAPLIRSAFVQENPKTVLQLAELISAKRKGEPKRYSAAECLRMLSSWIESDNQLYEIIAAAFKEYSYLIIEERKNPEHTVAALFEESGLFFVSFQLGESVVEFTARLLENEVLIHLFTDSNFAAMLKSDVEKFSDFLKKKG